MQFLLLVVLFIGVPARKNVAGRIDKIDVPVYLQAFIGRAEIVVQKQVGLFPLPIMARPELILGQDALGVGGVDTSLIAQADIFGADNVENRTAIRIVLGRGVVNQFNRLNGVSRQALQKVV